MNLAYASYYSGGLRVVNFGDGGIQEVGRYIDAAGNNFWGVEQFTSGGQRLIAASDRDFGLYIFRYTGPTRRRTRRRQPPTPTPRRPAPPAGAKPDTHRPADLAAVQPPPEPADAAHDGAAFRHPRQRGGARRGRAARPLHEHLKRGARGKPRMLKNNGAINVSADRP